jgi:hypothetical protein
VPDRLPATRRFIINRRGASPIAGDTPLPDANFTDAYSIQVAEPLDTLEAARRMVGRRPRWVGGLLVLRNFAVTLFGRK